MTAERIAAGLVAKYGQPEAYWVANRRVLGWLVDGTDLPRLLRWQAVRQAVHRLGASEVWS